MSGGGRIVIPARMRQALGLKPGDDVILELEGGQLRVMTRSEGVRRAQAILHKYLANVPSAAEELLAERRAEAARD